MDKDSTFARIVESDHSEVEKALLVLAADTDVLTAGEIAVIMESAGSAQVNKSRLNRKLSADRRTVKAGTGFRIRASAKQSTSETLSVFLGPHRPNPSTEFLDSGLFADTTQYVREIVAQINVTFSNACFDACSVMIRRLTETLIIEAFERHGGIQEITDVNDELVTLKFLIEKAKATRQFSISRQTKNALPHLKNVGDWSAHNRRHLARISDLEKVREHLRLASSDFAHLASLS
ncbi:DUF4145 domain-containing protein [Altererythrobacter sp. ZODW24]|uniref:DUF4145 domain-containing protein n=1 Tax=Altererythrobacter sp. ZODW24 TaxID=2185142 RepID=UPI0013B4005C|nr:DUF4145 domain-containing protein [Altererythrobacter sp. ZODW24]